MKTNHSRRTTLRTTQVMSEETYSYSCLPRTIICVGSTAVCIKQYPWNCLWAWLIYRSPNKNLRVDIIGVEKVLENFGEQSTSVAWFCSLFCWCKCSGFRWINLHILHLYHSLFSLVPVLLKYKLCQIELIFQF